MRIILGLKLTSLILGILKMMGLLQIPWIVTLTPAICSFGFIGICLIIVLTVTYLSDDD